ncbi:dihydrofolate reductase family protein [Euzebya sp.]|uniref:dihydrofolate reductase family protein n=1 Tax=Euzebya sp. TaxID=1971409 RepID=UPI003519741C
MRTVFAFLLTSLDGNHAGPGGEFGWADIDDDFHAFSLRQLNDIDVVVFGRTTYEHMAAWWPTAEARASDPDTAARMNAVRKVVYSRSLDEATWEGTELVADDAATHLTGLKREGGSGDIAIFGSSTLTASLLDAGVVDELRILVDPIVLGEGQRLFAGVAHRFRLAVSRTTTFRNGNVLLCGAPERVAERVAVGAAS